MLLHLIQGLSHRLSREFVDELGVVLGEWMRLAADAPGKEQGVRKGPAKSE
jgi:hypothetical protein